MDFQWYDEQDTVVKEGSLQVCPECKRWYQTRAKHGQPSHFCPNCQRRQRKQREEFTASHELGGWKFADSPPWLNDNEDSDDSSDEPADQDSDSGGHSDVFTPPPPSSEPAGREKPQVDTEPDTFEPVPQKPIATDADGCQLSPGDAAIYAGEWYKVTDDGLVPGNSEYDTLPWDTVDPHVLWKIHDPRNVVRDEVKAAKEQPKEAFSCDDCGNPVKTGVIFVAMGDGSQRCHDCEPKRGVIGVSMPFTIPRAATKELQTMAKLPSEWVLRSFENPAAPEEHMMAKLECGHIQYNGGQNRRKKDMSFCFKHRDDEKVVKTMSIEDALAAEGAQ